MVDAPDYLKECSISTGVVRYEDLAYILCTLDTVVDDGISHSRFFGRDRAHWGGRDIGWLACSIAVSKQPAERALILGTSGEIWAVGGGESAGEPMIADGSFAPGNRGPMAQIRCIANSRAYAVGTNRQVYRREAPGKWVCIDQSAQSPNQDAMNVGFKAIDGFSEQEIYAVGWGGEIWQYDGAVWTQRDSPTDAALQQVRCAADGFAYICGQAGTVLKGRGSIWQLVEHDSTTEDFWGLEWFDGRVFISSTHFVYELNGNAMVKVDFGRDYPKTCYHLTAADGIMWSIGSKDIFELQNKQWTRILAL